MKAITPNRHPGRSGAESRDLYLSFDAADTVTPKLVDPGSSAGMTVWAGAEAVAISMPAPLQHPVIPAGAERRAGIYRHRHRGDRRTTPNRGLRISTHWEFPTTASIETGRSRITACGAFQDDGQGRMVA